MWLANDTQRRIPTGLYLNNLEEKFNRLNLDYAEEQQPEVEMKGNSVIRPSYEKPLMISQSNPISPSNPVFASMKDKRRLMRESIDRDLEQMRDLDEMKGKGLFYSNIPVSLQTGGSNGNGTRRRIAIPEITEYVPRRDVIRQNTSRYNTPVIRQNTPVIKDNRNSFMTGSGFHYI